MTNKEGIMKTMIMLAAMAFPYACAFAADTGAGGFGGLNWGAAPSPNDDWQENSLEGKEHFYTRSSDRLEFGDAKLDYILYGFYKNKLSSVRFQSTGLSNQEALIRAMDKRYGNAAKDDAKPGLYAWQDRQTRVSVDCKTSSTVCEVRMEAGQGAKTHAASE